MSGLSTGPVERSEAGAYSPSSGGRRAGGLGLCQGHNYECVCDVSGRVQAARCRDSDRHQQISHSTASPKTRCKRPPGHRSHSHPRPPKLRPKPPRPPSGPESSMPSERRPGVPRWKPKIPCPSGVSRQLSSHL